MCVAEAAGGGSSTPLVPGVATAAADAAAALSAGPLGRARPLSGGVRVALLLLLCAVCVRTFLEALYSSEAAPSGSQPGWRGSRVTLGPAGTR